MQNITIIGTGNMGFQLAMALSKVGVRINQIVGRNSDEARQLAGHVGATSAHSIVSMDGRSDVFLLCVSDDAIEQVIRQMSDVIPVNKIVAHTSGSVPSLVVLKYFSAGGVFYPLQSIRKDYPVDFAKVPFFITSSNSYTRNYLMSLASRLSKKVLEIDDESRSKLHIPAVFVNNFVNYLYTTAKGYCDKEGLSFEWLYPLIMETAHRITEGNNPESLQTGPAIRKDKKAIRRHRELLLNYPEHKKLYNYISKRIQDSTL